VRFQWQGAFAGTADDLHSFLVELLSLEDGTPPSLQGDIPVMVRGVGEALRLQISERRHADAIVSFHFDGAEGDLRAHLDVDIHFHGVWHLLALVPRSLRERAEGPVTEQLDHLPKLFESWRAGRPIQEIADAWGLAASPGPVRALPRPDARGAKSPRWMDLSGQALEANRRGRLTSGQRKRLAFVAAGDAVIGAPLVLASIAFLGYFSLRFLPLALSVVVVAPILLLVLSALVIGVAELLMDLVGGACTAVEGPLRIFREQRILSPYRIRVGRKSVAPWRHAPGLVDGAYYRAFCLPRSKRLVNAEPLSWPEVAKRELVRVKVQWSRVSSIGGRISSGKWEVFV
jgi:hypothetical protein